MKGIFLTILGVVFINFINAIEQNSNASKEIINDTSPNKSDINPLTNTNKEETDNTESSDDVVDYEFVKYEDSNFLQSLVNRFSLYDETYLLPIYFAIDKLPKPVGSINNGSYNRFEAKFQVSFKLLVSRDLFYGIGFYFAYTQNAFFQIYSSKLSSPFRDSDFNPELILYKPLNIHFLSGEIYNIRFGYSHTSNGEGIDITGFIKSRGIDRVFSELMYKIDDFKIALKVWMFLRSQPLDIQNYMGYSSLKLGYDNNGHHLTLNIANLVHNYLKYKGNVRLEYRYDLFEKVGLYAQYFYGYGDNLYQYNIQSQHIGVGIAIAH